MEEPKSSFDSTADTLKHIKTVSTLMSGAAAELLRRGQIHDQSKLEDPEKADFDRMTPILKDLKYGTAEYAASLKELDKALQHHYKHNSHHPQFYENGVNDMDLFDLMEMFLDWVAATQRTEGGDILKSIEINKERFGLSDQLAKIMVNTVERFTE